MRLLILLTIILSSIYTSSSQSFFKISDSIFNYNKNKDTSYLNFYQEFSDPPEKNKNIFLDFSPLDINSVISDSTFDTESALNYGVEFDYNYDINKNKMIDFNLIVAPSITSLSLNFIKFSIIFYF